MAWTWLGITKFVAGAMDTTIGLCKNNFRDFSTGSCMNALDMYSGYYWVSNVRRRGMAVHLSTNKNGIGR